MKYLNPLSLFLEVVKKKSFESKSLLGLQLTEKYVDLAVSDSDNKVAVPLSSLNRQGNDFYLMADKFQILISKYNLTGIVVGNPSRRTLEKFNRVAIKAFFDHLRKTGKFEGLKYTYWDDLISSKHMEFQLKHNLEFMIEHLNLPKDKSKEIMDRCIAAHMLQKDYKDGKYSQVVSNALDMKLRDDLERLKKIKNHRGLRHYWGLRVRGQITKTTCHRGKTVGVSKKC